VVYHDPQPPVHPASEFPDTVAGRWQQANENVEEAARMPTSNSAFINVNLLSLLSGIPKSPDTIALRFVHSERADGVFGSETVQEYSQYRYKDISIPLRGTNFGRVLADCRKGS